MAFRAVHEQWGAVFSHLPDLGCGRAWEDVHRVRPLAPLRCDECRHPLRAKVSPTGLRFFAHAPGGPQCASAGESMAHHLLKLELATAAREAGAHVELEVRGPEGAWRADVMVSDPAGAWRIALEAQLSAITPDEIAARAARMSEDGVASVWLSDRARPPWLGRVPSVRLVDDPERGLVVVEGLARFAGVFRGVWREGPHVPVVEFLRWVFAGRVIPHERTAPVEAPLRALRTVWTVPQYAEAETALQETERRRAAHDRDVRAQQREAERLRRDQEAREALARGGREAAIAALQERRTALEGPVFFYVRRETGVEPYVEERGVPELAMGAPVYARGLYGVICPVASRVPAARDRLAPLVVFVASERERQRIALQARPGQRIVVLPIAQGAGPLLPRQTTAPTRPAGTDDDTPPPLFELDTP
ncbi:competence protein CoiA family protein [Streptomyces pseudogriseolus]|uniref:competence protein CoiA family protein n=1 Tax=Streptomyces pseudogriseolus TaxID=36817 RepID=UPI003FA30B72